MPIEDFKFKLRSNTYAVIDWANVYGWFSDPSSKNYLGWEIDPKKLFDYLKSYPEIVDIMFYYGIESDRVKSVAFQEEIKSYGYKPIAKEVKWVPAALETTAHFKPLVHKLFNVLDNVKNTNSTISTRLYELSKKVEGLPKISIGNEKTQFNLSSEGQLKEIYDLIGGLDFDSGKINTDVGELQEQLKAPVLRRKCDFDVEISRDIYNNLSTFGTLIIFSGDGDYSALVEDLILTKNKKVIVVFAAGHVGKEYEKLTEELMGKWLKSKLFLCSANNLYQFIAK